MGDFGSNVKSLVKLTKKGEVAEGMVDVLIAIHRREECRAGDDRQALRKERCELQTSIKQSTYVVIVGSVKTRTLLLVMR